MPWVSANLTDQNGNLLFAPYRSVHVGALRVAVIGLTSEDFNQPGDYQVIPPDRALSGVLEEVSSEHDLIVVLSNTATRLATRIAEEYAAVDLIIGADPKRASVPAYIVNNAVIVQGVNRGMSLGLFKADWTGRPWGIDAEEQRGRLTERLDSISWQISRLKSQKNRDQAADKRKMEALRRAQHQTETALAAVTQSLAARAGEAGPSTFEALLLPLNRSTTEDPSIRALIDRGKQRALDERGKD
jgi:2',3'-cyclic-nucleotide 2'-phosphodiesterase (5'-nucleotidase family)